MARSLRARIMIGFAVLVSLVTLVTAWTVINVNDISDRALVIEQQDFRGVDASNRMRYALMQFNFGVLHYITSSTDSLRNAITLHEEEFHHWMEEARTAGRDSAHPASLDSITLEFRTLSALYKQLVEVDAADSAGSESRVVRGMKFYTSIFLPHYGHLADLLGRERDLGHEQIVSRVESVRSTAHYVAYSTTILAIIILILGIVTSQQVHRVLLEPIRRLTQGVSRVAVGDFKHELAVAESSSEFNDLVHHFNAMVQRLRQYDQLKLDQILAEKRRCETIVRDLTDVIVATDEERRVIYFNRQAQSVTGIPSRLAVGTYLSELAPGNSLLEKVLGDIAAGWLDGGEEIISMPSDAGIHTYGYEACTIRSEEGKSLGYVFRLKDVTRFRELDGIKTKMVSTVSHELRTPLTSMGMSLELLLENDGEQFEPLHRELLENLQEDVGRLESFVSDLLDISQIESGKVKLRLAPVAPRELADEAARRMLLLTVRQEIQIDTTGVSPSLPPVEADRARIAQVLNNLYSNAIRYTPYRGTIAVSAVQEGDWVRFCVHDNGPGIPPGESAHIFEKFYQVKDDQRAGGSGLGLAIAKEIIESHGGRIWVESAVGAGSSFHFTMRVAK